MADNNLRIIYQNVADIATITTSSVAGAATPATNLQKDVKSYVYRSASSGTTAIGLNIKLSFASQTFGGTTSDGVGLILAFTNLTSSATIRVRGYTGAEPSVGTGTTPTASPGGTLQFDSGTVVAAPYQSMGFSNWNNDTYYTTNSSTNRYIDRKVYARVWVPLVTQITCTSLLIEIVDTNVNQFIEASRLIFGNYWSPKYNTSYGLGSTFKDTTSNIRSEAGDLLSFSGIKYNTISFDLRWLTKEDRTIFNKLLKIVGSQKALFVSLFPNCSTDWDKEQTYQIYGKVLQIPGLENSMLDIYSSQLDIEEV